MEDQNKAESAGDINLDTVSFLVPQAKAGSDEAREKLLAHIQSYVGIMAKTNMPTNMQEKFGASDIVQQSLAQVIQRFDDFRGESPGQFYAWLRTIVTNEARRLQRDFHRGKRDINKERRLATDLSGSAVGFMPRDEQPTPGTNAIASERVKKLNEAIDRLSSDYATVIRLRSLQRLPFKEVAESMGRSVGAVTKLWYRAILSLEQELEGNDEFLSG